MDEIFLSSYVVVGAQVKGFNLEPLGQGLKLLAQFHQFPLVLECQIFVGFLKLDT
jgi:hypothetical protein